ncbi:Protoporphyrinogen IX oxidase, novel form, HemJ [hydrothermal vent metagenome]|uniref:Protoporphyrinogen IX oxidase, novel form, HemJ n=1 Tax=hydrothermal vent metagenome TaxID=652676 RepID=A0A3B1APG6_9ZZZZ
MWLKALHLIFMVTWFAGLFYLPRLFVYHAMTEDHEGNERFKVMERKLYWFTTPWMILTIIFGIWMLYDYAWLIWGKMMWLHLKLTLVALLVAYHLYCGKLVKDFAADNNRRSHVWYRWFNEVPVPILVAIVLLAVIGRGYSW